MRTIILWSIASAVIAATPANARESRQARGEAELAKALAGLVAGKPESCISPRRVGSSYIIEGTAIIYRGYNGALYVNRPSGAELLHDDDIPVQYIYGAQICRLDQLKLLDRTSLFEHGFASLGDFVPYTRPKPAK